MTATVLVSGSFDDLRSRQVRFLHEASKMGRVRVLLWSDDWVRALGGKNPKFPLAERRYILEALRFVDQVSPVDRFSLERTVMDSARKGGEVIWAEGLNPGIYNYAHLSTHREIRVQTITEEQLAGFPNTMQAEPPATGRKKVVVTGCYDWLHSGHIRFFEEVSQLGDLYVVVGSDKNVRLLKGQGHPLFSQDERRYMVSTVRHVTRALISTGSGWMDAEPEIDQLKPDLYAVNEDGDKPDKRSFCETHGIGYVVLKRLPKEGLPRRESTHFRGF